jgi:hypothetical protein
MPRLRLTRNGRAARVPAEHFLEVVTPRTNTALISPAEHLCAGLCLRTGAVDNEPVALEIIADTERCRFMVRARSELQLHRLRGQLGAAYPQAALRTGNDLDAPSGDPLHVGPDEQVACRVMGLRAGEHLPIRMFQDRDLDAEAGSSQTDPLLGVLRTLQGLPSGWRMVSQLVLLEPAATGWARAYQRLALEHPILAERQGRERGGTSLAGLMSMFALGAVALVGLNAWSAWQREEWFIAGLSIGGLLIAIIVGLGLFMRFGRKELHDPKLVQEKLMRDAYRAELRLAVIAPPRATLAELQTRLDRLASAYSPFSVAAGNSFVPGKVKSGSAELRVLAPLARSTLLNVRELAGLCICRSQPTMFHLSNARRPVGVFLCRRLSKSGLPGKVAESVCRTTRDTRSRSF